jgi:hypothetical protein
MLAAAVAASLRRTGSTLRWVPDLLGARDDLVVMIDCKASMTSRGTRRHAVERAAVSRVGSGAPYYLVSTVLDRDFNDLFGHGPCETRGAV